MCEVVTTPVPLDADARSAALFLRSSTYAICRHGGYPGKK